ncbi:class I SAM-dependent methyltransferase [Ascidiimonas aurantiaca]|uniref:class I SAM-dependent methyltransferase n=1 Tax=Ascidiimonas aurantiaca TaxID=1685432 RepID=UPI0030EC21FF
MNIFGNTSTEVLGFTGVEPHIANAEEYNLGNLMYDHSKGMITESIVSLNIEKELKILELGVCGTRHLPVVFKQAPGLQYFGLDTSQRRIDEVTNVNNTVIAGYQAFFFPYNGLHVPYADHSFDRILTVNTIYFWQNPNTFLKELYRVLRPNGICVITFMEGTFMKNLSFINDSFQLYDIARFVHILVESGFENADIRTRNECVQNKKGDVADKVFLVATLQKVSKEDTHTKRKEYYTITN